MTPSAGALEIASAITNKGTPDDYADDGAPVDYWRRYRLRDAIAFALDRFAANVGRCYRVTGFQLPTDEAIVCATSPEHAIARLADSLQTDGLLEDCTHTENWKAEPVSEDFVLVRWRQ